MVLNVLLTIYAGLALIDIALMIFLHFFHDSKGYYKTASLVWLGIFLGFMADGLVHEKMGDVNHLFGIPLMVLCMYGLAKLAADVYRFELPTKKLSVFFILMWLTAATLHFVFNASFTTSSFFICLGLIAPTTVASYKLFRIWKDLNVIDKLYLFCIIAQSAHMMDYPFLKPIEGTAVFGFSLALFLIYTASVVIPVVINQCLSRELNLSLEKKVVERTHQLLDAEAKLNNSGKMATLGEMAGGVAHEINNPLAIIKTTASQMTELLGDEQLDKKMLSEMTTTIEKTTNRIAKIVHGLRLFSRDGSNDKHEHINVLSLIEDTVSFCRERFKSHGVNLTIEEFSPSLGFEGRSIEISQVLLNLLNNAYDAVADKNEKWVKVSVIDEADWVSICVTDSGNGISLELEEKIFRPFFTTKELGKGTGIGLSISLGIAQSHNGTLSLNSQSPNTCFVMRLPKRQKTDTAAA